MNTFTWIEAKTPEQVVAELQSQRGGPAVVKAGGVDVLDRLKEINCPSLVIVGDRTPPAENGRVVSADFLGSPALFPQGPFILAAILECPVFLFVCVRGAKGYRVHFEPFAERIKLPRRQREAVIAAHAQRYADRLAALCRETPFQWFNFFDFWAGAKPRS